MRNNDTINLKLCMMINIDSLHPIPASVFEIDAEVIHSILSKSLITAANKL